MERARLIYYFLRYGRVGKYLAYARGIQGWTDLALSVVFAQMSYQLPSHAVIVEIGSFLGQSTVVFAGARKLRGSGKVHCVDPFDASGDTYSVPFYKAIADTSKKSLRKRFDENIAGVGLTKWVEVHQGTDAVIAARWKKPIDLLFLDGDQSLKGARQAFEKWVPFLKVGGLLVIQNTSDRVYARNHDGSRRLVLESVHRPNFDNLVSNIEDITIARKKANFV